ncbi:MAG: pyruvate kinase [bacterium]
MNKTTKAPIVSLDNFKRTKIIATVGPSTNSYKAILGLIKAGANGIRLNFSHGTHDERTQQIKWIREASESCAKPVAIIQDLQGPKIRLGDFEGIINVSKGQTVSFALNADYEKTGHIPTQYELADKVKRGERIYLYDGKVSATVVSVGKGVVHVEIKNDGILLKRKGMNLPDTDFHGDIITAKDRADLIYGATQDIDYVALSFVQTGGDILELKKLLKNMNSQARVIAKIETKAAVEHLEDIIEASDGMMIARGDLALETPPESVPIVQRQIITMGITHAKPTIVATQMLGSMMEEPEPTRAEVSDVATAVLVGADCVMLSDETASGKYPIQAVEIMKRVIIYSEENAPFEIKIIEKEDTSRQSAISKAIINLAENIDAQAIVTETRSGATALQIASRRSKIPQIAVTNDPRTANRLAIVRGTKSFVRPIDHMAAHKLSDWLMKNKVLNKGDTVVTASGRYPGVVGTTDTIKVRVLE